MFLTVAEIVLLCATIAVVKADSKERNKNEKK